jgi:hypothetical protein
MEVAYQEQPNVVQGPWQEQGPESEAFSLTKKKQMFQEAEDALETPRLLAFRDEDFYHNFDDDQWSKEEKALLGERGQPLYTHNRCKKKIKTLKGMEQRGRTDPKTYPRKPNMEGMSEVATDVLNALDDKTHFDALASEAFVDLTVPGIEAIEIVASGKDIELDDVRYDEFFYDPRSKKGNFSDAAYLGYAKWFDLDVAKKKYPEQASALTETVSSSQVAAEYEDKPTGLWTSRHAGRKRVRIVVMYYKEANGIWRLSHFAGNADLYDEISPWVDDKDEPICGIVAQACYKDRENRCYGELRDIIGPQRELNHYRAKMWHYANNRRTWGNEGAFKDVEETKTEMAKVDGHVTVNPGMTMGEDWGFIESAEDVSIFGSLLGMAENEIGVQSPNEALIGRQAASQSGRAGEVQRDAGMTEEHDVFDLHRQWKENVYRHMFWRARQFWREPDYLRIVEEDNGADVTRFVAINEPVFDPWGQQVSTRNNMAELDVDIVVKAMPEVAMLQQEQYAKLVEAAPVLASAPPWLTKILIRASDLKDKKELEQMVEQMQQPPQPDPMQQQAVALEMRDKAAETEKTIAETEKIRSETQLKPAELQQKERFEAAKLAASMQRPQQPR